MSLSLRNQAFSIAISVTISIVTHLIVLGTIGAPPANAGGAPLSVRGVSGFQVILRSELTPSFQNILVMQRENSGNWASRITASAVAEEGQRLATRVHIDRPANNWPKFLPAELLDRPSLPVSAPDMDMLNETPSSGLAVRLRLYIDEVGVVREVAVLQSDFFDEELVKRARLMFSQTTFVPGRLAGHDVPSFKDVELSFKDVEVPAQRVPQ